MRLMVTWYDGNEYHISDINKNDADIFTRKDVDENCEDIISVVEVLPSVDYDKEGVKPSSLSGHFVRMLLK